MVRSSRRRTRPMRRRRLRSRRRFYRRSPRVKPDGMMKEKITIIKDVTTDVTGNAWVAINWTKRSYFGAGFSN